MYQLENYKTVQVATDEIQLRPLPAPLVPNSLAMHLMSYISLYDFNVQRHGMGAPLLLQIWMLQDISEMQIPTSHSY